MDIVNNLFDFIEKYSQENPMKLRLKRFENLNFNLSFAIDQIESRQKLKVNYLFGIKTRSYYFHLFYLPNKHHLKLLPNINNVL